MAEGGNRLRAEVIQTFIITDNTLVVAYSLSSPKNCIKCFEGHARKEPVK